MAKGEKQNELELPTDAPESETPSDQLTADECEFVVSVLKDRRKNAEACVERGDAKQATLHAKKYEIATCAAIIAKLEI